MKRNGYKTRVSSRAHSAERKHNASNFVPLVKNKRLEGTDKNNDCLLFYMASPLLVLSRVAVKLSLVKQLMSLSVLWSISLLFFVDCVGSVFDLQNYSYS